jgi:hypothetical protein
LAPLIYGGPPHHSRGELCQEFLPKKSYRDVCDPRIRHDTTHIAIMAKKRKAGGGASRAPKAPKEEDSRMAINTYEDVADSEDEFHMNRDKILLDEGPAAKRLRKYQEEG